MEIRRLAVLRELADRGTLAAVAEAMHLTPSAVSQQLKALEREVGIPLTERAGRGLVLTDAGRALADTAAEVAVAIARAEAVWEEYVEQPIGEVSLSIFQTMGAMLLPGVLDRIADVPGLVVRASDTPPERADFIDIVPDFDIVVVDGGPVAPRSWWQHRLEVVELLVEPLDIALPIGHQLGAHEVLTPEQVIDEPWIGVPEGLPFDQVLVQIEAATGRNARVLQRLNDNVIVEALVAAGHGLAILPRYTTAQNENGLIARPIAGIEAPRRVIRAIMRPDRAAHPRVRRVIEALQAEAARYAG